MNQQLQTNLIAMKNVLVSEIQNKYGVHCEVQLREIHSKRLDTVVQFHIIANGDVFNVQSFEVYQDRKGIVYWNNAENINENTQERVIN